MSTNLVADIAGRRIIVGVSGSIAVYKAVLLVRLLVKAGAEVRVLMTPAACEFVSPLTFSTLAKHDVLTSVLSEKGWNNHVELGLWADAYIIAPATANTLAKLANGICDNILAAVYLSARCPIFFAPAMDVDMWHHPSTQANIERLTSFGNNIIPVGEGELASGLTGAGRLAEPEDIVKTLSKYFGESPAQGISDHAVESKEISQEDFPLAGQTILVTSGPTHEPIDPVRFIGNRSSGKMGMALVTALLAEGAKVQLVLGPVTAPLPEPITSRAIEAGLLVVHHVKTALEMHAAATGVWASCQGAILAAAVADFRPAEASTQKIKKKVGEEGMSISLVKNPDIAAELGRTKSASQRIVGFALETQNGEVHALSKLERKGLDAIVLNMHTPKESAFGSDDNTVSILHADGSKQKFGRMPKDLVAQQVVKSLASILLSSTDSY